MRNTIDMQKKMKYRNRNKNFYSILACMKHLKGMWSGRVRRYITIFVVATKAVIPKDIKVQ